MSATFGHHPWSVQELVNGVKTGQVRLPDIQRPFVWTNAKIRDLIDSMYKGFPVGELMFWANHGEDHSHPIGSEAKTQLATMQIVDGQQRLTALFAVIEGKEIWRDDYTQETIQLAFNPLLERFEVPNASTRSLEWIVDVISVFNNPISARADYLKRLGSDGREVSSAMAEGIELSLNKLHNLLKYSFQVVQLNELVTREEVADIFVRINSEGTRLESADFILTWMSVFWEEGRAELENFARDSHFTPVGISQVLKRKIDWTPHNPYLKLTAGQMLRVCIAYGLRRGKVDDAYNRLRGRDPRTREISSELREIELEKLKAGQAHVLRKLHWDEYLKVLEHAGFRSSAMITSQNTVLYTYTLWLLGRVDFDVPVDKLREVMARWFFMSQITGRYTNSPESQIQEELSRLGTVAGQSADRFVKELNSMIDAAVPADWWTVTLPENLITSSTNSPPFVGYIAALNILDADVLLSTMSIRSWINPNRRSLKGIERHHLFPRDYLKTELKITIPRRVNQVANFALVEWSDNIDIDNEAPYVYWPRQVLKKEIGPERLARQEEWHSLPHNWIHMEYETFLQERRKLMAHATHEGFKRLTDPNYKPDLTRAVAPLAAAGETLPSLEGLFLSGILPPGTIITPASSDRETTGEITVDGHLQIGEHLYDSLARAARDDGADTTDGWEYWQATISGEAILLADLRARKAPGDSEGSTLD